jgi:hypothetical protein
VPNPFDATLKDLFSQGAEDFAGVFGLPRIQPAVALNVDLSTISAATDVALGFGAPLQEVADLNFQSGPDPSLEARCHLYSAALHSRFAVPVRSVIVLLRPKAVGGPLSGKMTYSAGLSGVEFRYEVVRLWEQPAEPFLQGGAGLLPLATLCKLPAGRPVAAGLRDIVQEIERRLVSECDHAKANRLMTAAFILTGLRIQRDAADSVFEGVTLMHDSSTYQMILDEGAVREDQRILLRLGQKRLGPPDSETAQAIKALKDLDRLERWTDAILTVASWPELLSTP